MVDLVTDETFQQAFRQAALEQGWDWALTAEDRELLARLRAPESEVSNDNADAPAGDDLCR